MCLNLNLNIRFGSGNSPNTNTNQMFRFVMFGSCSNTVRQLKIDLLLFFWQNFVGVGWTSPGFFDDVSHELALQHAISRYHTFVSPLICYILTILNYLYSVLDLMATSFFVLQLSSEFDITCRTWKPEVNKYLWLIFFLLITPTTDEWRHITNHSATTTAPTTNKWWYIRVGQTQWQKVGKGLGYVFYKQFILYFGENVRLGSNTMFMFGLALNPNLQWGSGSPWWLNMNPNIRFRFGFEHCSECS